MYRSLQLWQLVTSPLPSSEIDCCWFANYLYHSRFQAVVDRARQFFAGVGLRSASEMTVLAIGQLAVTVIFAAIDRPKIPTAYDPCTYIVGSG